MRQVAITSFIALTLASLTDAALSVAHFSEFKKVTGINLLKHTAGKTSDGVPLLMSQKVELPWPKNYIYRLEAFAFPEEPVINTILALGRSAYLKEEGV
jgi:hypothetical protein